MNALAALPDTLNEDAYSFLCDVLFRLWAQHSRTFPNAARRIRALLACAHTLWSTDQACPVDYADGLIDRAQEILNTAYRANRTAALTTTA